MDQYHILFNLLDKKNSMSNTIQTWDTHILIVQKKDTLLKKVQTINGVPFSPRKGLNRNPSHKWVAFNNPIKWTEVRAPYPISPRARSFSAWFIIYWFSGLFRWQSGACFYCVCHSPHSLRVSILSWRFIYFTMTCLPFTFWFSFPCLFMFSLTCLPFTEFRCLGNKWRFQSNFDFEWDLFY